MPTQKLEITPNVPIQIALKYPEGKIVEGRFGDQVYFSLAEPPDSCLYLDLGVAQTINMLGLRRGQLFWACKRWTGKRSDLPVWDFWPVAKDEMKPAHPPLSACATGLPESELEQQLRASLAEIERKKKAEAVSAAPAPTAPVTAITPSRLPAQPPSNNGNGTSNGHSAPPVNGNGAPKPYAVAGIPAKIPYDIAFRELLGVVVDGLAAAHEQWSDAAKQDMVSTLMIQASRDGFLSCWNRGAK